MEATVFFHNLTSQEKMVLIALCIQGLLLMVFFITSFRLGKIQKRLRLLLTGNKESNLEEILLDLAERMKTAEKQIKTIEGQLGQMEKEATQYLQRWSLQRYKAFANIGGDQSFTLVLLDRKGDGVMLSSIYGRDESRVYAKTISCGKANYPLSDEEQEVLAAAMQKRKNEES